MQVLQQPTIGRYDFSSKCLSIDCHRDHSSTKQRCVRELGRKLDQVRFQGAICSEGRTTHRGKGVHYQVREASLHSNLGRTECSTSFRGTDREIEKQKMGENVQGHRHRRQLITKRIPRRGQGPTQKRVENKVSSRCLPRLLHNNRYQK